MKLGRIFSLLALGALARYLDSSGENDRDFAFPKGGQVNLQQVKWFVWCVGPSGRWVFDAKGATLNPRKAQARACLWDALGVAACVLPSGSDPNDPETIPPDSVRPWDQVGRYVGVDA